MRTLAVVRTAASHAGESSRRFYEGERTDRTLERSHRAVGLLREIMPARTIARMDTNKALTIHDRGVEVRFLLEEEAIDSVTSVPQRFDDKGRPIGGSGRIHCGFLGHIHRLKLLKRTMYGRAKLDLLRLRMLAAR